MRVLVTGGAGFIGSHLVDGLVADGHEVFVYDNMSSGKAANVPSGVNLFQGDLGDAAAVEAAFAESKPEAVMHMAAQKSVSASVADPLMDARENIIASLNLFEAAARHQTRKIVFASTGGALYGDTEHLPTPESHPTVPESPYGVAKLSIEHYLRFYVKVRGMQAVTLRMANVYGPRQDPHGEAGVVAIFCSRALDGSPVAVYGDGLQTRDYTYVKDAAQAFLLALRFEGSTTVNVGTARETSVLGLIEGLEAIVGSKMARHLEPARLGEIRRSCLDASKAGKELGWIPTYGLHEGLAETVRYFRSLR